MATIVEIDGKQWVVDERNNRASIERWGSEEAARKALESLKDCLDCSDCFDCSDCSGCSGCSDCTDCIRCSGCTLCSYCTHCYRCPGCIRCTGCSRCSRCFDCSGCSDCSGCTLCSGCSDCSDCSGCTGFAGVMPIPVIDDIHRKVYEEASGEGALDMDHWHTCETTHCRAGWVIHLAGEAGYELERKTSPVFAAMQIYKASGYEISPCRFFDSHEDAMEDMRKLAERGPNA